MSRLLGDLPRLFPRPEQTIAGIGRLLRRGEVSCVDILNACLEQVDEWEPKVHAWVVLDREGATEQACSLDEELRAGQDRGPLHGIPLGIKDIMDVRGLPTACGARRWSDRIATSDFLSVGNLRENGAVIMGKTVTTPYAWIDPPVTRNPWDLERTPGGSSSGSAAAVACGMCYGAIGSQTGGSITRPASFCGIAGMKPCYFRGLTHEGILPLAPSLDHVGPLAHTVTDLRLLHHGMQIFGKIGDCSPARPPRLARYRGFFDRRAEPSMLSAFEEALGALARQGVEILEIDDPIDFDEAIKDHRMVMSAEAAHVHSDWLDEFPDDYPPRIKELVLEGRSHSALEYLRAKQRQGSFLSVAADDLSSGRYDTVVSSAAIGTAPDRSTTGDPAFNSPWSFAGYPTITFPMGLALDGLPLGLQFVNLLWLQDQDLLRTAEWCEDAVRNARQ